RVLRGRWFSTRRLVDALMHAYVLAWLLIFVLPFTALLDYSFQKGRGYDPLGNYSYVFFGTFKDNIVLSLQVTLSAIVLNTLIAVPAARSEERRVGKECRSGWGTEQ